MQGWESLQVAELEIKLDFVLEVTLENLLAP